MDITNQTILYYLDNRDKVNELTNEQKSECINYCVNLFEYNTENNINREKIYENLYCNIGYGLIKECLEDTKKIQELNNYKKEVCVSYCKCLFGNKKECEKMNQLIRTIFNIRRSKRTPKYIF